MTFRKLHPFFTTLKSAVGKHECTVKSFILIPNQLCLTAHSTLSYRYKLYEFIMWKLPVRKSKPL